MKIKVQSMKESRINSYRESDNEEVLMFKLGELQKNGKLDGFTMNPDEDGLRKNEFLLKIDNSSQMDDVFEALRLCKSSGVIADFNRNADASFIVTKFEESKKRSKKEETDPEIVKKVHSVCYDLWSHKIDKEEAKRQIKEIDDTISDNTLNLMIDAPSMFVPVEESASKKESNNSLFGSYQDGIYAAEDDYSAGYPMETDFKGYSDEYIKGYKDRYKALQSNSNKELDEKINKSESLKKESPTSEGDFESGYLDGYNAYVSGEAFNTADVISKKDNLSNEYKRGYNDGWYEAKADYFMKLDAEEKALGIKKESDSSSGYLMADAPADIFENTRDQWKDAISLVSNTIHNGEHTIEVRGYKSTLRDIEKKLRDLGFRILKRDLEESKSVKEGVDWDPEYGSSYNDGYEAGYDAYETGHHLSFEKMPKEFLEGYQEGFADAQEEDNFNHEGNVADMESKKESTDNNAAVKELKDRLKKEFSNRYEVVGPTTDIYDPDHVDNGEIKYYVLVPYDTLDQREVERVIEEIASKYPNFEYEGVDFSDKLWFNLSEN